MYPCEFSDVAFVVPSRFNSLKIVSGAGLFNFPNRTNTKTEARAMTINIRIDMMVITIHFLFEPFSFLAEK